MHYLVLDLEMCKVPRHYRSKKYKYANEIIQVGAVLMDEDFNVIGTISQYVHPEFGVIDHYITELTGIQSGHVKKAPRLKDVLIHMTDWVGEREYQVYAWSSSDYCQLQHEITSKELEDERIASFMEPDRWIDYQEVFGTRFEFSKAVSLSEALMYCDIDIEGRLHDGLSDACNTAQLIKKLETSPEFVLYNYDNDLEREPEPLNFSMGSLFAGLCLSFGS